MGIYIIAEAGVNYNGNIKLAKCLIDMAKEAGANATKFQTFKAEESTNVSVAKAAYRMANNPIHESQLNMTKKLELPFEAFGTLREYCVKKEIDFISTPDGVESLKCLIDLNAPSLKIGSTGMTNCPFLHKTGCMGKAIISSTGMSRLDEVEKALNVIREIENDKIILMHCTTDYPTAVEDMNLEIMMTLKNALHASVGYSDHTLGSEAAIAAVTMRTICTEKYITLDQDLEGPDHKVSMGPNEFAEYVLYARNTVLLLGDGEKKPIPHEKEIMIQVRRSILAKEDLKKGIVLSKKVFCYKRSGDGIAPEYADILNGRALKCDVDKDNMILWEYV